MTNEDDIPFEILSPTPGMAEVLLELRMRLDLWTKSDASPAVSHVWEDLPLQAFSAELARYPLILSGLGEGGAAEGSVPEADLYHRLSQELGIMSTDDLKTEFLDRVEGRHTAADFRRVQEAASIDDLVRNDMALGWSGFEITPKDDALVERARRERMFADYFRGALNWTHLRAWDIARAAALAEEAYESLTDSQRETIGADLELYKKVMRENALYNEVYKYIVSDYVVSEDEFEQYYEQNRDELIKQYEEAYGVGNTEEAGDGTAVDENAVRDFAHYNYEEYMRQLYFQREFDRWEENADIVRNQSLWNAVTLIK